MHSLPRLRSVGRASQIEDVADFIVDFIVSDLLGVVSSRLMHSGPCPHPSSYLAVVDPFRLQLRINRPWASMIRTALFLLSWQVQL